MKHLAAYILLVLGGNETPSADDVIKVITSVGGEADEEKLTTLITDLEGKDIHELLAKGESDLKSVVGVSSGSAAPSGGASSAPAAAAPAAAPEKPKEEEVDALDGGMDMFGGSGGGSDY
mmetsp:Transcript_5533/g.4980  ORF Transcript_5533/g.4980 Transcript_5533/m.4980 type:complete len:120 (+) Transcript_5533:21-380(+)